MKNNFRLCSICGNEFRPTSSNAKYCGMNCKRIGRNRTNNLLRRKPQLSKNCELCGKKFKTSRNIQKVCIDCREDFVKDNKKKYYYNVLKPKFGYLDKGKSYPQFFIYNILVQEFSNFCWTYNDRSIIRNPETNYPLELDIYCKNKRFAVEFDGEHHFSPKQFGIEKYLKIKKLDKIKDKLCIDNNIKLLRISHKDEWRDKKWVIQNVGEHINVNCQTC
jgi:hypothetical protein